VKYYASLAIAASLFAAIILTVQIVPQLKIEVKNAAEAVKTMYPGNLELTMDQGKWAVNQPEPYIVAFPQSFYTEINKNAEVKLPKNIIVFDHAGTIDDLAKYDTFALINDKNMIAKDDKGIKSNPIQNIPNGKLDKPTFDRVIDQFAELKRYLPVIVGGAALVFFLMLNVTIRVLAIAFGALFVWLAAVLMKIDDLGYKKAIRINVHAATLAITADLLAQMFRYQVDVFGFFSVLTLVYSIVVLITLKRAQISLPAQTQPQQ